VPDLMDFTAGLATLCDERTVITVENPSFLNLLREVQFDTIYHEHFSYLSAHAVGRVVEQSGLRLVRIDKLGTHGGSNRYWLTRDPSFEVDRSVAATITEEVSSGLLSDELWTEFRRRSRLAIDGLRTWLDANRESGRTVAGYGAAAKGNTLMNAARVRHDDLAVVVDGSVAKQGKFLPGSQVPVVAPAELTSYDAEDVLILPWNLAPEISAIVAALLPGATSWVAIPEMRALGR
jgi:hypothetical protein